MKLIQTQTQAKMRNQDDDDGDEDAGVETMFFGQLNTSEHQSEITALDIAIIGFWRLNNESAFECYNNFKVTNPMKRMVKKSQREKCTVTIKQFLYHGKNGEIYFFFKESDPEYYKAYWKCDTDAQRKKIVDNR